MKERIFYMHTKTDKVLIKAKNRDEAFAKFFKDVEDGKIGLETLGNIVILFDRREEYPFRTVPLLWKMMVINDETAIASLQSILDVSRNKARKMLEKYGEKDARLIPLIDTLVLQEKEKEA